MIHLELELELLLLPTKKKIPKKKKKVQISLVQLSRNRLVKEVEEEYSRVVTGKR
jgi:hypothetical protein